MADLSAGIGSLELRNPVMTASGTFGFGLEFARYGALSSLGALITKSITLEPRPGNPAPRIWETPSGMLNAIGLENPGLEFFASKSMPLLRKTGAVIVVNIAGSGSEEYRALAGKVSEMEGVSAIEVNAGCPNVKEGGLTFGREPEMLNSLIAACRRETDLPLLAKLTPNVADIVPVAQAAVEGGADAVCAVNTLLGMSVDVQKRIPRLANVTGGLSGPAIRPVALRCCYQIAAAGLPVVGIGGITDVDSALEFILCGALAVQIGTMNFVDPGFVFRLPQALSARLDELGVDSLSEYKGSLRLPEETDGTCCGT